MKIKKAIRKLAKVETLLTGLIDKYAGNNGEVRELLDTAKASVARAKKSVSVKTSSKAAKKPPAKADTSGNRAVARRKRVAPAVKKQAAVA